jgi:Ca2+-binding EF-hand superfamily protein
MEAFKSFDRNGSGQLSSPELLGILKRRLPTREYEQYVQLLSGSYGPLINYIDFFPKPKNK